MPQSVVAADSSAQFKSQLVRQLFVGVIMLQCGAINQSIIIIIVIMEKTEAGLRGLCIREIDVKSQILVT